MIQPPFIVLASVQALIMIQDFEERSYPVK